MDMSELLKKKKGDKELDPKYKDAKMGILKDISDMASKHMGDDIKGLKKVSVAAPDKAGLKLGLHKAEDMIDQTTEDKYDKDPKNDEELVHDADGEAHDEHDTEATAEHGYTEHGGHIDADEKKKTVNPYDDEEVEAMIGKYLEDPSEETMNALLQCIQEKEASEMPEEKE